MGIGFSILCVVCVVNFFFKKNSETPRKKQKEKTEKRKKKKEKVRTSTKGEREKDTERGRSPEKSQGKYKKLDLKS